MEKMKKITKQNEEMKKMTKMTKMTKQLAKKDPNEDGTKMLCTKNCVAWGPNNASPGVQFYGSSGFGFGGDIVPIGGCGSIRNCHNVETLVTSLWNKMVKTGHQFSGAGGDWKYSACPKAGKSIPN